MSASETLKDVVTIDGPAGSGKSTVAAKLASKLRFVHLNSGAIYRAVGVTAAERGVDSKNEVGVADLAQTLEFEYRLSPTGETEFLVGGVSLGEKIFSREAGVLASHVAVLPKVRELATDVQRKTAFRYPVVVEGRDAGTVVFPGARYKFFLNATVEERAHRRFLQLQKIEGRELESEVLERIRTEIAARDNADATRSIAPMLAAEDAIQIDTTGMSIDDVVMTLFNIVRPNA